MEYGAAEKYTLTIVHVTEQVIKLNSINIEVRSEQG